MAARDKSVIVRRALGSPGVQAAVRPAGRQRVERRLMCPLIEQCGPGSLLGTPDGDRLAVDDLGDLRGRVVQVPDHDRLGRADSDAGRLEADLEAVRAQVAFLGRVVVGIDEDRVIRAGGDARFAADTGRLVEVDDTVRPLVHRAGRACAYALRVRALIAANDLEG